jgi:spore coat protein U-like protein
MSRLRPVLARTFRLAAALVASLVLLHADAARANDCQRVGSAGLAFGVYDPFAGHRDAVGSMAYECSANVAPRIQLGAGQGSYGARELRSGGSSLRYDLYVDTGRQRVWGDGSAGTETVTGPASDEPVSVPIYGRIFRNQPVAPGAYGDTVVITLLF